MINLFLRSCLFLETIWMGQGSDWIVRFPIKLSTLWSCAESACRGQLNEAIFLDSWWTTLRRKEYAYSTLNMCNKLNQSPHKKNITGPKEDFSLLNPFNPKDDWQLISPYSNNAKSFKKIMRNEETITNVRSFDY